MERFSFAVHRLLHRPLIAYFALPSSADRSPVLHRGRTRVLSKCLQFWVFVTHSTICWILPRSPTSCSPVGSSIPAYDCPARNELRGACSTGSDCCLYPFQEARYPNTAHRNSRYGRVLYCWLPQLR